jgi:hypothetical protein
LETSTSGNSYFLLRQAFYPDYFFTTTKNICTSKNHESLKKYENIFSGLGRNPTPVEPGPPENALYSAQFWTLWENGARHNSTETGSNSLIF